MAYANSQSVIYHLRDKNADLVQCWSNMFSDYSHSVKVSHGDIFKTAPEVDAIVSPSNSFGFMDGGIDSYYQKHFGPQLKHRLQKTIREEFAGELLVGQATIVSAYGPEGGDEIYSNVSQCGRLQYLISAPTMRIPMKVDGTPNAYLAFRAVILAVKKHNMNPDVVPIKEVLVPGLGTAAGKMPTDRCAWQMLQAYETFAVGESDFRAWPEDIQEIREDHMEMCKYKQDRRDYVKLSDV